MTEKVGIDKRWAGVLAQLPAIPKGSTNAQQGFKFRSVDDVLDRLKPLLGQHGLFVVPIKQVARYVNRPTAKGGVLHVCYLTVDWEIRSVDGDIMIAQTIGEGTDSGDKATSKAQTMAFKYLLWPALAIATNEDPDGQTAEATAAPIRGGHEPDVPFYRDRPEPPTVEEWRSTPLPQPISTDPTAASVKQINYLVRLLDEAGIGDGSAGQDWLTKNVGPWPGAIQKLTKAQAGAAIDMLKGS